MHFQVPQYLDVEDKIIGPLTLKQFIYLLLGGGLLFLLYSILKFPIFIIFALPIAFFVLLLAFYKKDNQKFTQFFINLVGFITRPNVYTWKKSHPQKPEEEPALKIIKKAEPVKKPASPTGGPPKESELEEVRWEVEIKK